MKTTTWISGVRSLAGQLGKWLESRMVGVEMHDAGKSRKTPPATRDLDASELLISVTMLQELVEDIKAAESRFLVAIKDTRCTPAELDEEEKKARATVCRHLRKIAEFNGGALPDPELERVFASWRCDEVCDK